MTSGGFTIFICYAFYMNGYITHIEEETKNFAEAIQYRRKISVLDPLNYINLLQLGEDMKASGDTAGAKSMITKIDSFAPQSDASKTAHKDFGSL